jgi:uncharacterized metal-binding protein YceD (DUF177 family)
VKIVFDKIGQSEKPFALDVDNVQLKGTLIKSGYHRVQLDGMLHGSIELNCDRCGEVFPYSLNMPLRLTLSDQVIETEDDLDIIEFIDGVIDLDFIVRSEIASIENSYHQCEVCKSDESEFEKEF